jgi:hypothetical protein
MNNPYTTPPEQLTIGPYNLLQLAFDITRTQHSATAEENLERIVNTIRLAFICGCQRGKEEAQADLQRIIDRLPAPDKNLPGPEDGLPPVKPAQEEAA